MVVVDSRIESVKVYRSGATVCRRLTLCVSGAAPDEIEVRPLPLSLYDPTVRLTVLSVDKEGADVVAAEVRVGLAPRTEREAVPSPDEAALKANERDRLRKARRGEQLEDEIRLLESVPVPERARGREDRAPPPSPLAARVALDRFTDDTLKGRREELRTINKELRDLDERLRDLRAAKERASTALNVSPGDLVKTVVARLRTSGPAFTRAELLLEYFVPGARWAPAYQCHLSRDGLEASILLRALVCQRTGEDWSGVKLQLSTAAPLQWTELPELSSIRIGRAQPAQKKKSGFRAPPTGALALFSDYDLGRERAVGLLPRTTSWEPPHLDLEPLDDDRASEAPASVRTTAAMRYSPAPAARAVAPPPLPRAPLVAAMRSAMEDEITGEGDALYDEDLDELGEPLAQSVTLDEADDEADAFESNTQVEREALRLAQRAGPSRMKRAPGAEDGGRAAAIEAVLFTHLELGAPDDRVMRNRLRPVDERRRYLELLVRAGVTVTFDVLTVVRAATSDAEAVASLPLPEGAVDVGRVSGSYDFAYDADDAAFIGSDGAWTSVPLGTRTCEADMRYVVVPREDVSVYRVAMLKNPIKAPLLAGPTEVYVGGEYVLTARLPTVAPGGEVRLGLGVEQSVKCARNARFTERHSGDRVGMTLLDHRLEIEIVNHLPRDIECEVRERVPQADPSAEVMVEEDGVEPAWEEYDQEERSAFIKGGRRWLVTVPALGEKKLRAGYVVRIYANTELVGGNRREA